MVNAAVLALKQEKNGVFNIGTGIETNINDIFSIIKKGSNFVGQEIHGPNPRGEQQRSCLDNSKAKVDLGWEPKYNLEDGIKETVNWFKKNKR